MSENEALNREKVYEEYLQYLKKDVPEEINKIHGPFWEARYDLAKNVVSLSSASLVLTITFSKSLLDPNKPVEWKSFLLASWVAFLLSLIFAVFTLWISIHLKSVAPRFFNQQAKFKKALYDMDWSSPNPTSNMEPLLQEVLAPIQPISVWAGWCLHLSLISFISALIFLGVFGWGQFAT